MKFFRSLTLLVIITITIIAAPRLGLLFNGIDSQRIWDTNTPAAFQFLAAAKNHSLQDFFLSGQKYPLLGSYAFLPVIIGYYGINKIGGVFHSPTDFMWQYALGETNLFLYIRLEMLLLNLAALFLLYRLTVRVTPRAPRAALYVLGFAALNFYVTFFSVMPRIHSFAFFAVTLTLYASTLLLEKKTRRNYVFAFGAACIAGSVSQSGVAAFALPIAAHLYDSANQRWRFKFNRQFIISIITSFLLTIILGYPRTLAWLFSVATQLFSGVILGDSHGIPTISFTPLALYYLVSTEFISLIILACALVWLARPQTRHRIALKPYDYLALIHIVVFFAVFSFSSVFSGRFMLAVFPSVFFITARLLTQLEKSRVMMALVVAAAVLQLYGVAALTISAWGGDTRQAAAEWLLKNSNSTDRLLSTIDPTLLGIVPHPDSITVADNGQIGTVEKLIRDERLVGSKTRLITYATASNTPSNKVELKKYQYIIVATDPAEEVFQKAQLNQGGFNTVAQFNPHINNDPLDRSFIPWDFITPKPRVPHPFALSKFKAFGPTITIYSRN